MCTVACVASVSVWFRSKERPRNGILGFGRAINETRAKKMKVEGGGREGRKRFSDEPLDFENLRSPANAAPDWLGYSNNFDMCRLKVCFILR